MRIPNPIANTTTEAYLAYKAGVLAAGDLKPKLYYPYLHFDAWLAYWGGLVNTYPIHDVGKNLFDKDDTSAQKTGLYIGSSTIQGSSGAEIAYIKCLPNTTYTVSKVSSARFACATTQIEPANGVAVSDRVSNPTATSITITTSATAKYIVVFYYLASADTKTKGEVLNSLQIEEGSTATPYEPYTGTPECFTDEEALVAYLSGVTNTYPETVKDPEDVRIAGYLRYLVSARFGRPAYPVNNRELYLSMLKPPVVTNDTPSASIVLEDTVKAEFIDVKMFGDTSQQTYTGKNLCGIPDQTFTHQGINVTIKDGEVTMDGTAIGTGTKNITPIKPTTLNGSYTTSLIYVSGTAAGGNFNLRAASDSTIIRGTQVSFANFDSSRSYTIDNTEVIFGLYILSVGAVFTNYKFKVQIVAGSTTDYDYEPYVGGTASPNPDYPQAVQTVTGRQTISVRGKNMLSIENAAYTSYGVTSTCSNNRINVNRGSTGTGTSFSRFVLKNQLTFHAGDTITLSANNTQTIGGVDPAAYMSICLHSLSGDLTATDVCFNTENSSRTYTFAADVTIDRITVRCDRTLSPENITILPQLERGSTATDFEPYQSQEHEVNLGSIELCKIGDYQDHIYKDGQQWYIHKKTGKVDLEGLTWTPTTPSIHGSTGATGIKYAPDNLTIMPAYAEKYSVRQGNGLSNYVGWMAVDKTKINVNTGSATTKPTGLFYYQLGTPIDTEITNAALVAQLDALAAAKSYNDKTYITVEATDPNLPALLKVEAGEYR